ncbi:hypothetical protein BpHYR1_039768 [Brachionus plicatilis]|uniref:Uncharacterized protein n=1 Tax=Brachionus plicatilis TaxID=10195 RepID=A0A3M7SKT6_BRAPC|nr:hypothetical protein BpHYR1_039768 [Brachionus plicatilis]
MLVLAPNKVKLARKLCKKIGAVPVLQMLNCRPSAKSFSTLVLALDSGMRSSHSKRLANCIGSMDRIIN